MAAYQRQLEELYTIIEQARVEGFVRNELSNDWIMVTIDTMIYSGWWLISEGKCTAQQAADQAIITLFGGIAKTAL
jgi:hypothetical protein